MAFITNQKTGGKKLGDRLSELVGHSKQLDMLVGFFFFSGVKIIYDALKVRAGMIISCQSEHVRLRRLFW